jgi:aryl-alcohol dehydrogenase-like predicted oxidoreductase
MRLGDRNVRRIGFGALRLLGPGGFGRPERPAAVAAVLARAGSEVDVIDTADCYGPYLSEEMIAETLHPYRDGLVIATKGGLTCPRPGAWIPDASPDRLRRCCLRSLRRLRIEQIELYQLHAVDPEIEFERSVDAIARLREDGLVRHVGLCNVTADQVERARGIVPVVSVQNRYNVVDRSCDVVVDLCAAEGIAFLPWFPLERGALGRDGSGLLASVAVKHRTTAAGVALAWLLHRSPTILPIPGTSSLDHFAENLLAGQLVLDDDDMRALDQVAQRPERGI